MGSYVADDEYGDGAAHGHVDDPMDGLVYAEPESMQEEDERRLHAPSIRKHDASGNSLSRSSTFHSRQPSTYPPIAAGRPSPGGLFPPAGHGGVSSTSASPISQNGNMTFPPAGQPSGASIFHPTSNNDNGNNNSIDSPKQLSPNALSSQHGPDGHQRAHSPFQQQPPFGRPAQSTGAGPGLGLPPPQPGVPQLPPPPGMSSTDTRFTLPTPGSVPPPSATAARHTPSHSHSSNHNGGSLAATAKTGAEMAPNSSSSYSHDVNMLEPGSREDKLWSYIRSVHEELVGLRTEVSALRAQVASSNVNGGPGSQSLPEGNSVNTGQR